MDIGSGIAIGTLSITIGGIIITAIVKNKRNGIMTQRECDIKYNGIERWLCKIEEKIDKILLQGAK